LKRLLLKISKMEKIKAALLSFGMSGKVFHAPFINLHPGFVLAGAWERSKKAMEEMYAGTKSFSSMKEILEDESITLVVVNTPTYTHYEYAKKALLAGKHVIVEKAFTTTVAEAEELKELAEKQGRKLAVFQNRRWDSDFKTVKKIIDEGLTGDLVEAEFHYDRYNPNLSPKLHKEEKNAGAGLVKDLGPHLIDQALFLFGMPNAVFADIRTTREHSDVDDWFDLLLYYPTFRVRLKAGYFVREAVPAFVVHGRKGSFLKNRGDVQEASLLKGIKPNADGYGIEPKELEGLLHTEKNGEVVRELIPTLPGNYMEYYEAVYQSIAHNKPEPVTAADGVKVMKVIEAALKSSTLKKAVEP
jgi:scyllo-inositol 2-dehydrogenase (NADP+)